MEHAHEGQPSSGFEPSGTEKLLQALELMEVGLGLKRAALARQHPDASEQELEQIFQQWLFEDD